MLDFRDLELTPVRKYTEERVEEDSRKYFEGRKFYCLGYAVVAFKDSMKTFKDFYYITESTLIEKEVFDQLLVLDPVDISNRYLDQMVQVNNPHSLFIQSDIKKSEDDFKTFMEGVQQDYYENFREFETVKNPGKDCLYRIVATSNYSRDDYTESVIADNMKLDVALRILPVIDRHYGEDSDTFPKIKPVLYKPFIWTP